MGQGGTVLDSFQREVLVRRSVGEPGDQTETRFADARADAVEEGQLPDRREDHALDHDLLHLVKDRRALLAIELDRLQLIERVEIGIAAVRKDATLDRERLETRGCVAESPGARLDDILELLLGISLDERRSLDRPQFVPL